jgi:hypothetical protein
VATFCPVEPAPARKRDRDELKSDQGEPNKCKQAQRHANAHRGNTINESP